MPAKAHREMLRLRPLRLIRTRVALPDVEARVAEVTGKLVAAVQPEALLLFGSAARGEFTDQSDLDFLVIMRDRQAIRPAQKAATRAMPLCDWPVDLVWVARDDFERKRVTGGVCQIAAEEGRYVYRRATGRGAGHGEG